VLESRAMVFMNSSASQDEIVWIKYFIFIWWWNLWWTYYLLWI